MDVDASATRVEVVISKRQVDPSTLYPCAFFTKRLSLVEQNYDSGNRELLAIKLALEECRQWLEGANHPFEIFSTYEKLAT